MSAPAEGVVWLDGELLPAGRARVPIDDLGFLYGAACFETVRASQGHIFRLDRHLRRLSAGLAGLGVASPPGAAALGEAIVATLEVNALGLAGMPDARVRLTVTAGRGAAPDLSAAIDPTVLVTVAPAPAAPARARLAVSTVSLDERRPLREAKQANFLPYLLAREQARTAGFDDALLLNHAGAVAESAVANVFALLDGVLVTPALAEGPLPGVTREAVIECAARLGLAVEQRRLPLDELTAAEEVLLTNSVAGVHSVRSIAELTSSGNATGRWTAASGPGKAARRLSEGYEALVREERAAARA